MRDLLTPDARSSVSRRGLETRSNNCNTSRGAVSQLIYWRRPWVSQRKDDRQFDDGQKNPG
jgi:hypothetical protein